MSVLVTRDQWRAYMNTGTAEAPEFHLIGEGFTAFSESKNPKEYSRQYVHEKTERTDVVGFAPSISYSADMHSGDPCVERVAEAHDEEQIGNDARVEIVAVNMWEKGTGEKSFAAYKRTYSIIPDTKGDGNDALIYSGTFKANGEAEKGSFTITDDATGTFSDAAAAAQQTES